MNDRSEVSSILLGVEFLKYTSTKIHKAWWYISIIPALRRLGQED
jgi:hypothetical protein